MRLAPTRLDRWFLLSSRTLPWMDAVRCLALGLVVLRHTYDRVLLNLPGETYVQAVPAGIRLAAAFGWSGVHLFFVISGFLVGGAILADIRAGHFGFGRFYLRRLLRIMPVLWLVIALTVVELYVWGGEA